MNGWWATWSPKHSLTLPAVGRLKRGDSYIFRMTNLPGKPFKVYYLLEADPRDRMLVFSSQLPALPQANAEHFRISTDDFVEQVEESLARERHWLEENDPLYDDIQSNIESRIEEMANWNAAMTWSTPSDDLIDRYGEVWIEAEFGGKVAINGDPTDRPSLRGGRDRPPEGYEFVQEGGRVPSTEEEVQMESVIDSVAKDMNLPLERVQEVADDLLYGELTYTSVAGETEVYAPVKEGEED